MARATHARRAGGRQGQGAVPGARCEAQSRAETEQLGPWAGAEPGGASFRGSSQVCSRLAARACVSRPFRQPGDFMDPGPGCCAVAGPGIAWESWLLCTHRSRSRQPRPPGAAAAAAGRRSCRSPWHQERHLGAGRTRVLLEATAHCIEEGRSMTDATTNARDAQRTGIGIEEACLVMWMQASCRKVCIPGVQPHCSVIARDSVPGKQPPRRPGRKWRCGPT